MRLIYLSPMPWHSFTQRPHELVRCFHERTGEPVLWIEPYPTRFPTLNDLPRLRAALRRSEQPLLQAPEVPSWLRLVQPIAMPIEPLPGSGWLNRPLWQSVLEQVRHFAEKPTMLGIGKPSSLALRLLREPLFQTSFYDAMDNFSEFYEGFSRRAMERRQRLTAQAVSTVLTSSSALQAQMSTLSANVMLLGNACAAERLPSGQKRRKTMRNRPVLGYVGTIAKWFAWEIVVALAKAFPHAEVRLIGPLHTPAPMLLPPNIRISGEVSHAAAINAMADFDIGLIPFKCDALTHFVDPIKYYEYRALGLPVISTAFGEMASRRSHPGTFLLDGPEDIARAMDNALKFEEPEEQTLQFRRENSWRMRFSAPIS
ncbi:glycosyltransferase [Pseudomonas otitidis]|uniref:Glycosyltransferase n=1 Tax=Metapseudomonas otitidis TaxID=319939 RepID=A0A7X3H8V1_9GAMM|nr:glycosyltransferase [Pseudomonas otitidis]MWK57150.1 glycosyltransferase [Pseudomonas otitidis]